MPAPLTILMPSDREIVVTREFEAAPALVWRCYTEPALLKRWYGLPDWEMTVCEIDLRVGGRWRFVSRAPSGWEMGSGGVYTHILAPQRIENTELFDEDWTGGETRTSLVFHDLGGDRTRTTTAVLYASREARDGALATPMAEGMEAGFKRLDALLAAPPA
jgi:uncharacterized protein YndB with AHSA1/START domain